MSHRESNSFALILNSAWLVTRTVTASLGSEATKIVAAKLAAAAIIATTIKTVITSLPALPNL